MEQAINSFQKGLQMDTSPMQQGTDTLSNALNATFITMNGNEVILQNDMGNARVDNAVLPNGYMPVGVKEYGGIIYIAAYNPITNMSQIGSFPSPSRIDGTARDGQGGTLNLTLFLDLDEDKITKESLLIPISNDNILRAGDKFTIYSENIGNFKNFISNWDNINNNTKVKSPKNNYLTLSVGILNSQNEFVDITKNLKRFKNEEEFNESGNKIADKSTIIDISNMSDLLAFNSGYFIKTVKEDIFKEKNVDSLRSNVAINTYGYKLVGPMYLKAQLNVPTDIDYSIYGSYQTLGIRWGFDTYAFDSIVNYDIFEKVENQDTSAPVLGTHTLNNEVYEIQTSNVSVNKYHNPIINANIYEYNGNLYRLQNLHTFSYYSQEADPTETVEGLVIVDLLKNDYTIIEYGKYYNIVVESILTYNCPDGLTSYDKITSDDYVSYAQQEDSKNIKNILLDIQFNKVVPKSSKYEYIRYNPANNTYSIKIIKEYQIVSDQPNYNYTLTPTLTYPEGFFGKNPETKLIKALEQTGTIDLSKLGSGEMYLTAWRFYNDVENKITYLTYAFDSYPRYHHSFEGLKMEFYLVNDNVNAESLITTSSYYRGTFTPDSSIGYNGKRTDVIEWEDEDQVNIQLESNQMYQVKLIWYDRNNDDSESNPEECVEYRWLLTTELLNSCYNNYSSNFVVDYANCTFENDFYKKIDEEYLIKIDPSIDFDYTLIQSKSSPKIEGKLLNTTQSSDLLGQTYTTTFSNKISANFKLSYNKENLPEYVHFQSNPEIEISTQYKESEIEKYINFTNETNQNKLEESWKTFNLLTSYTEFITKNYIEEEVSDVWNIAFNLNEQYKSIGSQQTVNIQNVFKKIDLDTKNPGNNNLYCIGNVTLATSDSGGHSTHHYMYASRGDNFTVPQYSSSGDKPRYIYSNGLYEIFNYSVNGDHTAWLDSFTYEDKIYDGLNAITNNNQQIVFGVTILNQGFYTKEFVNNSFYSRPFLWVKCTDEKWAVKPIKTSNIINGDTFQINGVNKNLKEIFESCLFEGKEYYKKDFENINKVGEVYFIDDENCTYLKPFSTTFPVTINFTASYLEDGYKISKSPRKKAVSIQGSDGDDLQIHRSIKEVSSLYFYTISRNSLEEEWVIKLSGNKATYENFFKDLVKDNKYYVVVEYKTGTKTWYSDVCKLSWTDENDSVEEGLTCSFNTSYIHMYIKVTFKEGEEPKKYQSSAITLLDSYSTLQAAISSYVVEDSKSDEQDENQTEDIIQSGVFTKLYTVLKNKGDATKVFQIGSGIIENTYNISIPIQSSEDFYDNVVNALLSNISCAIYDDNEKEYKVVNLDPNKVYYTSGNNYIESKRFFCTSNGELRCNYINTELSGDNYYWKHHKNKDTWFAWNSINVIKDE